jgi:ribosome maturation factor RimP
LREALREGERENIFVGTLEGIENDIVTLTTATDTLKIPLGKIGKTKLEA